MGNYRFLKRFRSFAAIPLLTGGITEGMQHLVVIDVSGCFVPRGLLVKLVIIIGLSVFYCCCLVFIVLVLSVVLLDNIRCNPCAKSAKY